MNWHPDVPELPLDKPEALARLEQLPRQELDSMPPREVDHLIQDAANALANSYYKKFKGDADSCRGVVVSALQQTGAGIGGKFGMAMVAQSEGAADKACKLIYSDL